MYQTIAGVSSNTSINFITGGINHDTAGRLAFQMAPLARSRGLEAAHSIGACLPVRIHPSYTS